MINLQQAQHSGSPSNSKKKKKRQHKEKENREPKATEIEEPIERRGEEHNGGDEELPKV